MEDFDTLWQAVTRLKPVEGILPLDMLEMPEPLGGVIRRLIRRGGATLEDLAGELKVEPAQARQVGEALIEKGYLAAQAPAGGRPLTYHVRLARLRQRGPSLNL